MAAPTTKAEFKEYCLRKLGKPVIEINVDDDQAYGRECKQDFTAYDGRSQNLVSRRFRFDIKRTNRQIDGITTHK